MTDENPFATKGSFSMDKPKPPPLPATQEDLLARRTSKAHRDLLDETDEAFLVLWKQLDFRRYNDAVYVEDTIEGSFVADDLEATELLREYAREPENVDRFPLLSKAPKHAIAIKMRLVRNRYHVGRQERLENVNGHAF